ncbi:MAG TPA: ribosome recycling factor [Candidatus Saccharimonadales bacterium]|nr:ribosome recycling factor [Candidatus Saccharimonadales bacterium]
MFDTTPYTTRMQHALQHFEDELKKIRTGRANPGMLDGIMVEAYGQKMPLIQVATITVPEPQLLQLNPFDPTNLQAIVAAIRDNQTLGLNPSDDGRLIRVPIPPLTQERRQQIVKQLGEKIEDCRIAMRNVRHDALKAAKAKKDAKELSEDDVKRIEKSFDDTMRDNQSKLDALAKAKEQEIMTI